MNSGFAVARDFGGTGRHDSARDVRRKETTLFVVVLKTFTLEEITNCI